jgi:hypothetical protein
MARYLSPGLDNIWAISEYYYAYHLTKYGHMPICTLALLELDV